MVLYMALSLIHIKTFLSARIKKILDTIWYSHPCYETPEAMSGQSIPSLLLNLGMGQDSSKMHGRGFIKAFDHIFVLLKNKNMQETHSQSTIEHFWCSSLRTSDCKHQHNFFCPGSVNGGDEYRSSDAHNPI